MNAIFWLPAICVAMHMTEEFIWPGGFSAWFRAYRTENALSFTPRFAFWINALLVVATACEAPNNWAMDRRARKAAKTLHERPCGSTVPRVHTRYQTS